MKRLFLIVAATLVMVGCATTQPRQPRAFTCTSDIPEMCELQRTGHDMRFRQALVASTQQQAEEKAAYQRKADENCRFVLGADSNFC